MATTMRTKVAVAVAVAAIATGAFAATSNTAGATTSVTGKASYTVTKSGAIHGPSQLPSGPVELIARGSRGQSLQVILPNNGVSRAQIVQDATAFNKTYKPGAIERDVRFVGGVDVGHSMWVSLPPGRYYLTDFNAGSVSLKTLDVLAQRSGLSTPASTQVRAVGSMSFAGTPSTLPRTGWLRFSNRASQDHFIVLQRLKPGVTLKQVQDAVQNKINPDTIIVNGAHNSYDAGVVSPRWGEMVSYTLNPGTYALLCFWPDANGVPHAAMGMYRLITVK